MSTRHELSLSVIIPTLNEARNIERLLNALLQQESSGDEKFSYEIIVCDGGSDDATPQIVENIAAIESRVLLIQSGRGTSHQRNAGAAKASGELLIWMDADDFPGPKFLNRIARSYQNFPFAVACPWFVCRDSGVIVRAIYFGFNILFFLGQSTLRTGSGVCLIAPKTVWQKTGGFDASLHLGEDVKFIREASPRFGLHRHLFVPLETSGRRFAQKGAWNLVKFYTRISPLILLGRWKTLQKLPYEAAPYFRSHNEKPSLR